MLVTKREVTLGLGAAMLLPACTARADAEAGQARADLYDCEGCEAALEGAPAALRSRTTLGGASEPGERMLLMGRVLRPDGRTPAPGVVVYAHHTNAAGLYAGGHRGATWSARHGRLRGWVVSAADGGYAFDTIKPAPYPDRSMPAHVHLYIAEPGRRPYYIDDVVFAGEFRVDDSYRRRMPLRGGNGIVPVIRRGEVWHVRRDIILERHPA
ncbi:hypothetical protein M9980_13325 [Sphingomonas donggukensis]|uniref:Intradiol ring-cleavage dioxygenases domain-containing protein n=1 Tax=Sphingomonas donggukensis TaxID=2949093 RepID=A0ABY4TSV8_9SPHN|nr:hypothetical protein [Sphingomonas donggukensis]URW75495.1 hypothetical protein M9980_13325 [Sphingomonas donggukensis]